MPKVRNNDMKPSKMQKSLPKICRSQKKAVPLHSKFDYGTFVLSDILSQSRLRRNSFFNGLERIYRSGGKILSFFALFLKNCLIFKHFFVTLQPIYKNTCYEPARYL